MPEISVIVAVYNVKKYISTCVESILQQTYKPKEIILIDDASTDSSSNICDEFEQNYNIVWTIHQKNAGLSGARNTGIQNSRGGYCYFIDGDDYILPNTLENFIKILRRYPKAEVIHGRMSYFIDGTDVLIPDEIYIHNEILTSYSGQQVFVDTFQKIKALRMGIRGLYNRDFLIENNLYFKPHIYSED